jgi:protein-tyrosine phosphatase
MSLLDTNNATTTTTTTINKKPTILYNNSSTRATEIRSWLFLGGEASSRNLDYLISKKITHIINAADDVPNAFPHHEQFHYLNLNLKDGAESKGISRKQFTHVFNFVDNALSNNGICFVHCRAGVNRSAAVVCAILMERYHLTYFEALSEVSSKRPISIIRENEVSLLLLSRRLIARRMWNRLLQYWQLRENDSDNVS